MESKLTIQGYLCPPKAPQLPLYAEGPNTQEISTFSPKPCQENNAHNADFLQGKNCTEWIRKIETFSESTS